MMATSQEQLTEMIREGVRFAREGDRKRAEAIFREVIAQDDANENAWLWLAGLTDNPAESLWALERTLQINPNNPLAQAQLNTTRLEAGIAAARTNERTTARELLQQVCEDDPNNEAAWLWLAGVTDVPEQAAAHLEHVLHINPNSEPAKAGLEHYRRRGSAPSAPTGEADGQASASKWYCPVCLARAETRFVMCQSCKAILSLSQADKALNNAGPNRERIRNGITRLTGLARNKPDFATFYYLGMAYLNLGQLDDALVQLQAAIRLKPEDDHFLQQVGALRDKRRIARISAAQTPPPSAIPGVKKKSILVVDDSPTIRKLIGMTMGKNGYQIIEAEDGNEALEKIQIHGVPDLVLLDVNMPGMDGYAVCKILRQNPLMVDTPVIMLSGKDGFFNKIRGKMSGSTMYLSKPFQPDGLLRVVQTYCPVETTPALVGQ